MNLDIFGYLALFTVVITSLGILISQSWRWSLVLLALQYLGVFILVALSWPFLLVLAKLIAGWMTVLVLWIAYASLSMPQGPTNQQPDSADTSFERMQLSVRVFRLFAAAILGLVFVSVAPIIKQWFPSVTVTQIIGSLVLIGIGLLQLGLTSDPFRVTLGLLTILMGFEILYAGMEISALVQGLLAGVTLGLGLIGAYLILSPTMGETLE